MIELAEEEFYEDKQYKKLLDLKSEDFYLHLPKEVPYTKWFFEFRLQLLHLFGLRGNYFALRHRLEAQHKWFSDWVFLNHYLSDYKVNKKWKPKTVDQIRYYWLMATGYRREMTCFAVLSRDKDNLGIRELRFFKTYCESCFWSYLDYERDGELAFFRLGLDCDESLKNEDKPLFPNIAYSYPDDPRLAYFLNKAMVMEHIPKYTSWPMRQIVKMNVRRKWNKGRLVTYADIRDLFNPETMKIHDLEFLFHIFGEHGGKPEDPKEEQLYNQLYILYANELAGLAKAMHIPELEGFDLAFPKRQLNPLYIAYKQRWIGKNKVKEFQKLFHGVTEEEYQDIVNKQYKSLENKPRHKSNKDAKPDEQSAKIDELIVATLKKK